jgi:hypothetical protein
VGWRYCDGDGIGGSEDVASETAKITRPSARRQSPALRGGVLWHSATKAARDLPDVVEKRRKAGKLGSTNHARNLDRQTTLVSHQHEIKVVKGKMKLRWETKIPNRMHEEKF